MNDLESNHDSPELTPPLEINIANLVDQEQGKLIQQLHQKEKILYIESLTSLDLCMAAVNAYCSQENSGVPHFPKGKTLQGYALVHETTDPILYAHFLNYLAITYGPNYARNYNNQYHGISIEPQMYDEYIDTLQACSRIFIQKPELYQKSLISLVGGLNYLLQKTQNFIINGHPTMIKFTNRHENRAILKHPPYLFSELATEISEKPVIYIPGAGYNTMGDLPEMLQNPQITFLINDCNEFVTGVLAKMSQSKVLE